MEDFNGCLGAAYICPLCRGFPGHPLPPETMAGPQPSLRVFLNIHNEVVLRCHACGFAGTALDLVAQRGADWPQIVQDLATHRVFGDMPVPQAWIERAKFWQRFSTFFELAQASYRCKVRADVLEARFGEVGVSTGAAILSRVPELGALSRLHDYRLLVEVRRSLLGLPLSIAVSKLNGAPVAHYLIHPREPVSLAVPDWALYRDWTKEIVLTTDLALATQLQHAWADQSAACPPIAWIFDCQGPVLDQLPFRQIHFVYGPKKSPEVALAFAHGASKVIVACPEAGAVTGEELISLMAERITALRDQGVNPVAYLAAILEKPWIAPETARRLTHAVAVRLGETAEELITQSGVTRNLLPFHTSKATYLCRNGVYLRARDLKRRDFLPCSNFCLSLLGSAIVDSGQREALSHSLRLTLGGHSATFEISGEQFENGQALLQKAIRVAVEQHFPALPWLSEPADMKLLPALIKATQVPRPAAEPGYELGWQNGAFCGPGYVVDGGGLRTYPYPPGRNSAGWMRSGKSENISDLGTQSLRRQANELGTWLAGLQERQQRGTGALIYAALDWLHRSSRSMDSFLLAPSRLHLDFLGELCGLVPIEIGRCLEHPWAPRLMASFYQKPWQFRRHGHLVAGIECADRKIDPSFPRVVYGSGDTRSLPEPPGSFLPLLAYSCVGMPSTAEAITKLSLLAQSPEIRTALNRVIGDGSHYLAGPGGYLRCFLDAVNRHYGFATCLVRSRRQIPMLPRAMLQRLRRDFDYGFRESQLVEGVRLATGLNQSLRYGKAEVPAFSLSEELLGGDSAASQLPSDVEPAEPGTSPDEVPVDLIPSRSLPPIPNPDPIPRLDLPSPLAITSFE